MATANNNPSRDEDDTPGPARYRAYTCAESLAADHVSATERCATGGCHADSTVVIHSLSHAAGAYCTGCAHQRLAADPTAREYPLEAVALPADDHATSLRRIDAADTAADADAAGGAAYELSHTATRCGTAEMWVYAHNPAGEIRPRVGSGAVVSLEDYE